MEELRELKKKGFWKLFRSKSSASKDEKSVRLGRPRLDCTKVPMTSRDPTDIS